VVSPEDYRIEYVIKGWQQDLLVRLVDDQDYEDTVAFPATPDTLQMNMERAKLYLAARYAHSLESAGDGQEADEKS